MNQTKFDNIILENLKKIKGENSFNYVNCNGFVYEPYYSNVEFQNFIKEMQTSYASHYEKYNKGKGSELKSTNNGQTPPKMASVASSSRFCYLALRRGATHINMGKAVEFEVECAIKDKPGTQLQLDAFDIDTNTYLEVKCHEIFSGSKAKTLEYPYKGYIYGKKEEIGFNLSIDEEISGEFPIPYQLFGLDKFPKYFDLKQFLCHLLGIACENKKKPATLAYLFFRPKTDDGCVNADLFKVFAALQAEIVSIFTSPAITRFCSENNITLNAYYEYATIMEQLKPENTHLMFAKN